MEEIPTNLMLVVEKQSAQIVELKTMLKELNDKVDFMRTELAQKMEDVLKEQLRFFLSKSPLLDTTQVIAAIPNEAKKEEKFVKLSVGGRIFETTLDTLTSQKDSMLSAMFSGKFKLEKTTEGAIFIDRNPTYFEFILEWLRSKELPDFESPAIAQKLIAEAEYFGLETLIQQIQESPSSFDRFSKAISTDMKKVQTLKGHTSGVNKYKNEKLIQIRYSNYVFHQTEKVSYQPHHMRYSSGSGQ